MPFLGGENPLSSVLTAGCNSDIAELDFVLVVIGEVSYECKGHVAAHFRKKLPWPGLRAAPTYRYKQTFKGMPFSGTTVVGSLLERVI